MSRAQSEGHGHNVEAQPFSGSLRRRVAGCTGLVWAWQTARILILISVLKHSVTETEIMSPFTLLDVAPMRDSIHIHSAVKPEEANYGGAALDQGRVLAEGLEHHAGLLIFIGTATLSVMALSAVLLIFQILLG